MSERTCVFVSLSVSTLLSPSANSPLTSASSRSMEFTESLSSWIRERSVSWSFYKVSRKVRTFGKLLLFALLEFHTRGDLKLSIGTIRNESTEVVLLSCESLRYLCWLV